MNNKISIYYHAGSYGTFIEWCLNYFSDTSFSNELPFTNIGNSHKFNNTDVVLSEKMFQDAINQNSKFVRLHPGSVNQYTGTLLITPNKTKNCYRKELKILEKCFQHVVVVYFGLENILWGCNNSIKAFVEKNDHTIDYFKKNEVINYELSFSVSLTDSIILRLGKTVNDQVKNWNKNSIAEMQPWELREFLSLYMYSEWVGLYQSLSEIKNEFPNIIFLEIGQLRDDFHNTISSLLEKVNLTKCREDTEYIYNAWSELQHFKHRDSEVKKIVNSTINNIDLTWDKLSIIDEAEIQRQLRVNGWEIKCFDLDIFPTSSTQLRSVLYRND